MGVEDYYSYATRQAIARQRAEREAWAEQQREEQEARVRENAATRQRYLAGLEARRAEVAGRREDEIDAALAPAKERALREFLIAHPGRDAAEFEAVAWPLVRANLLEDELARVQEATKLQLRSHARYNI
jgi:hypothetical protein